MSQKLEEVTQKEGPSAVSDPLEVTQARAEKQRSGHREGQVALTGAASRGGN